MSDDSYTGFEGDTRSAIDETIATPCTALTVLRPTTERVTQLRVLPRTDPSFLTHLIATEQHSPQTRTLRRASSADALTAYRATADRGQAPASLRTRLCA